MIVVFLFLYNKKRKEKNIMGKSRNEVNGVLVYRRWCAGAILSAIAILLIIAVPVAAIIYNWVVITVPGDEPLILTGYDLIKPVIFREDFAAQDLINAISESPDTKVKYFALIMKYYNYAMFGFLALIAFFGVIEIIFFIFYVLTGRVVSPVAPVRIGWVLFGLTLVFGGLTFGWSALFANAYTTADGNEFNFLQFLLAGIIPGAKMDSTIVVSFFWPAVYIVASLVAAIIMSIIYFAAFRDKFYIGRARRFGGNDQPTTTERYETTHIYTNGTQTSATNGGQPQVIVVNSGPAPAQNTPIIATLPGQTQPVVIQTTSGAPVQQPVVDNQGGGEIPTVANTVLPSDIRAIGGHAYSKNLDLKYADIPSGIKELGVGAFANCLNLEVVSIPKTVKRIKKNCFFNCVKLARINYAGTKSEWRYIVRGSNWLDKAGTKTVVCSDGAIIVDPHR